MKQQQFSSNTAAQQGRLETDSEAASGRRERPDIVTIMADIRARVKADAGKQRDARPAFVPRQADPGAGRRAGELLNAEELRYLNSHYAFGPALNLDSVTSHRPGVIGKLIVKAKRKLLAMLWDLLKDYFAAEREFHANLVRFLNDTTKYMDARDASNFWELIRKIDVDITKALERIERINDEQMGSIRSLERRVFDEFHRTAHDLRKTLTELEAGREQHGVKLSELDSVARGLESIVAKLGPRDASQLPSAVEAPTDAVDLSDYSYLLLENRYRGSEQDIQARLAFYPPIFSGASAPVLEIGPGRGELLEMFMARGIDAYGVDVDAAMVERSREKGLRVELGDGVRHLMAVDDRSLGGVIAIQVVEHLPLKQLEQLFKLCVQKVRPGGAVVCETINPRSMLALSSNYFRDPTHVWPLHPDTLGYMMSLAGLDVQEIKLLSPVSAEAMLKPLPIPDAATPRWVHTLNVLNQNVNQLNELLYGNQDYCIIGRVRD